MKHAICKILMAICILTCYAIVVSAAPQQSENIGPIPDELMFTVSSSCAGHDYFYQASANEAGDFAILSRYTNIEENQDLVFNLCYVDIYTSDGLLLKELSFYAEQNCAVALSEQSIVICFFDKILFYDYITDEQSCLFLGADEMLNETELDQMDQHEFTVGQWQYTCKKGFHGYTELVRTNDALSEILVTLPGSGFSAWNTLVPALALFLCLLLLRKYNRHRKEN